MTSNKFKTYLSTYGNKTRLAEALDITKGAVAQWDEVPVKRVLEVERVTGIARHELRPDFFLAPTETSA